MGGDYISIDEAARRSGLHPNSIQRLLREGKLAGYKEHHDGHLRWYVSVNSLDGYTNPWTGYLLDRPGPKLFLRRRDDSADDEIR